MRSTRPFCHTEYAKTKKKLQRANLMRAQCLDQKNTAQNTTQPEPPRGAALMALDRHLIA